MRFELKTDQKLIPEYFSWTIIFTALFFFILILGNLSFHIQKISKQYEINYLCKLLLIEKNTFDFDKLIRLTKETSKSKLWELCKEIAK